MVVKYLSKFKAVGLLSLLQKTVSPARRKFLGLALPFGALSLTACQQEAQTPPVASEAVDEALDANPPVFTEQEIRKRRAKAAYQKRLKSAQYQYDKALDMPDPIRNGDEQRYAEQNYYASFVKTLPQNQYGEVEPAVFETLVRAMQTQHGQQFPYIPISRRAQVRHLANPQGALLFHGYGVDSHATTMKAPHQFRSTEVAAEMAELYWLSLLRDVPFTQYEYNPTIEKALEDLNTFSNPPGQTVNGRLTVDTIFRGETPGDLIGPYISQFLISPIRWGANLMEPRVEFPLAGLDFLTDENRWHRTQLGESLVEENLFDERNYYFITNIRLLGEFVHQDLSSQVYLNVIELLADSGIVALNAGNPYRTKIVDQRPFVSCGLPHIWDMVVRAGQQAFTASWYHKWCVHRYLRPEEFAGRVHFKITQNKEYEVNDELLNCRALQETYSKYGTFLLSQAYGEGSPTHPSYPSGHATIAGACVTVLKACFDEDYEIETPFIPHEGGLSLLPYTDSVLKVGGELNKLANNISIGRNGAGVHYRQDGIEGMNLGEQVAIEMLREESLLIFENEFEGFIFTKFDGQKIQIVDGEIYAIT